MIIFKGKGSQPIQTSKCRDLGVAWLGDCRSVVSFRPRPGCSLPSSLHAILKVHTSLQMQQQKQIIATGPSPSLPARSLFRAAAFDRHLANIGGLIITDTTLGVPYYILVIKAPILDGVPFNRDRSQTLETITWNIMAENSMRIPLAAFRIEFACKGKTVEDIFAVLLWIYS